MSDLQVKKAEDGSGQWHVVRADGSIKSKHESQDKAEKSASYAKNYYTPVGRGRSANL